MNILLLELNEFNEPLLQEAGKELCLKNIERLLNFHKSETWTEDIYESDYLEPWVQWVSIHTGTPSSEHQIKHLGDVPTLKTLQLWEKLSEKRISSGIWGAMNAGRNKASDCLFFLPDPWTASENAFPEGLDALLMPLRSISKNYTHHSKFALLHQIGKLIRLFKMNQLGQCLAKESLLMIKNALLYRGKPFVFVSFLDILSTRLFLKYKERYNPTFSLLFLNSIAHLQHHEWKHRKIAPDDPLAKGFKNIDRILGHIFNQMGSDDLLIVTNALSQKNTWDEKPWILYRQIDHQKFLQTIGIQDAVVESHMTHDAHLFFASSSAAQNAREILQNVTIQGAPLFHIEVYPDQPLKIFYRIQFTDELPPEASFQTLGQEHRFFDLFTAIVQRTGKHVQNGTLFCNHPLFPSRMFNHEICDKIVEIATQNCHSKEPLMFQSR